MVINESRLEEARVDLHEDLRSKPSYSSGECHDRCVAIRAIDMCIARLKVVLLLKEKLWEIKNESTTTHNTGKDKTETSGEAKADDTEADFEDRIRP